MITEENYNSILKEVEDMFLKDNTKYNTYKWEHSKYVANISIKIYEKFCKMKKTEVKEDIVRLLGISCFMHDLGKLNEETRGENHAEASVEVASKILAKYPLTDSDKFRILTAIGKHSDKTKEQVERMSLISRIVLEADLISKTYINDMIAAFDDYNDFMKSLNIIIIKQSKKYKDRKKILSPWGKKVGSDIEKDFSKYMLMALKQKKILKKE